MTSRARLNLLLLVVVAALGWLAYLSVQPEPGAVPEPLTGLRTDTIGTIVIQRTGAGEAVQMLRSGGRWWLRRDARPLLVVDPLRVDKVLDLVRARSEASYPLEGRRLRDFGLDPPRLSVVFDGVTLQVGDQEPLNYRRYVAVGDRLHLVLDTAFVHLLAPWNTFVDPDPAAASTRLTAIETARWRLQRQADATWQAEAGGSIDAQALAAAWLRLRATETRADEAPTGSEVLLRFADGSLRRLRAAEVAGELLLAWPAAGITYSIAGVGLASLGLAD